MLRLAIPQPRQMPSSPAIIGTPAGSATLLMASVQEAADLMTLAFDKAEEHRNPVILLSDASISQMMEPVELPEMSELGLDWHNDVTISSMCTVFAESEVVSLIARSTAPADIIHGLNKSVAGKTAALARRTGGVAPFMMTGGVARNRGVVKELETALKAPVEVSEYSQLCGSLGAALFALEKMGVKL